MKARDRVKVRARVGGGDRVGSTEKWELYTYMGSLDHGIDYCHSGALLTLY